MENSVHSESPCSCSSGGCWSLRCLYLGSVWECGPQITIPIPTDLGSYMYSTPLISLVNIGTPRLFWLLAVVRGRSGIWDDLTPSLPFVGRIGQTHLFNNREKLTHPLKSCCDHGHPCVLLGSTTDRRDISQHNGGCSYPFSCYQNMKWESFFPMT